MVVCTSADRAAKVLDIDLLQSLFSLFGPDLLQDTACTNYILGWWIHSKLNHYYQEDIQS